MQDNGGTAHFGRDVDVTARTMSINVTPVNDPPSGADKTVTVNEDTAYTLRVSDFDFNDADDLSPPSSLPPDTFLNVMVTAAPTNGTLRIDGAAIKTFPATIAISDFPGNLVTFTPATNANSVNTPLFAVPFKVQDTGNPADGNNTDPIERTITFNVTSVNDVAERKRQGHRDSRRPGLRAEGSRFWLQ